MAGIKIPNPKKEAEKAVRDVIRPAVESGKRAIEGTIDKVKRDAKWQVEHNLNEMQGKAKEKSLYWINNTDHWAKKRAKDVELSFETSIERVAEQAEEDFKKSVAVTEEAFDQKLPAALKEIAEDLQGLIAGKVGDLLFGIAGQIAPGTAKVGIGPFECDVHVKNKLPKIREWIVNPPANGNQARDMLQDLTDDETIIVRPAAVLPFRCPLDPRIPVAVKDIPSLVEAISQKLDDLL